MKAEAAASEGSAFLQLLQAAPQLRRTHVAEPAGASALQHQGEALRRDVLLRAITCALGKIADIAVVQCLAGRNIGRAADAEAHLIEVVSMVWAGVVAVRPRQHEPEVVGVTLLAAEQVLEGKAALAMPFLALRPRQVLEINDLDHRSSWQVFRAVVYRATGACSCDSARSRTRQRRRFLSKNLPMSFLNPLKCPILANLHRPSLHYRCPLCPLGRNWCGELGIPLRRYGRQNISLRELF